MESRSQRVRAYPALERHRLVWVWPGDAARADPALVPDLHWNSDPAWEGDGATLFARCDYRLLIDNLMDLTHETFVHSTSIGHRAIAETPAVTTHDEKSVTVTRWMLDIDAPPSWRTRIFEEDRAVVEAQQLAMDAAPQGEIHNLNIDAGSVWARRIIERMITEELSPASL